MWGFVSIVGPDFYASPYGKYATYLVYRYAGCRWVRERRVAYTQHYSLPLVGERGRESLVMLCARLIELQ